MSLDQRPYSPIDTSMMRTRNVEPYFRNSFDALNVGSETKPIWLDIVITPTTINWGEIWFSPAVHWEVIIADLIDNDWQMMHLEIICAWQTQWMRVWCMMESLFKEMETNFDLLWSVMADTAIIGKEYILIADDMFDSIIGAPHGRCETSNGNWGAEFSI